jgi:hypothetical protein
MVEGRCTRRQWINSLEQHVPEKLCHSLIDSTPPQLLDFSIDVRHRLPETRLIRVFGDAEYRGMCTGNVAAAPRRRAGATPRCCA